MAQKAQIQPSKLVLYKWSRIGYTKTNIDYIIVVSTIITVPNNKVCSKAKYKANHDITVAFHFSLFSLEFSGIFL